MTKQRVALLGLIIIALVVALQIPRYYNRSLRGVTGSAMPIANQVREGGDMFGIAAYDMAVEKSMMPSPIPPMPGYEAGTSPELIPSERLIIRTASVAMVVKDVGQAIDAVSAYAVANGGYEVSRNVYKTRGLNGTIVVRVPVDKFAAALGEVQKLGEMENQQVNGTDVTEEFVDVAAQLKNLRAAEEQFLAILKQAQKIEDILSVQRELTSVRSQIERLEGRKKYLEQNAAMSTITVNFSTDPNELPVVEPDRTTWRPLAVVKDAVRALMDVGIAVATILIQFVVFIPLWILIGAIIWGVYRVVRRALQRL